MVATLAVLGTKRARVNGSVFAVGFVLGQVLALFFEIAIGSVTTPGGGDSTASGALEIVVGLLLLVTAERARHHSDTPRAETGKSRTQLALDRLERVTPRTAFSVGVTLGIGLKRLVITVFAASTIALANLARAQELALGAFYVLLASVLVWAPITVYLVAGAEPTSWSRSRRSSWPRSSTRSPSTPRSSSASSSSSPASSRSSRRS